MEKVRITIAGVGRIEEKRAEVIMPDQKKIWFPIKEVERWGDSLFVSKWLYDKMFAPCPK